MEPSVADTPERTVAELFKTLGHDPVVTKVFGDGNVWVGDERMRLSGLDWVACAIARTVLPDPTSSVAVAVPRGLSPLPVLVGLYLVSARLLMRRAGSGLCGSIAVSTQRTELREVGRSLALDGSVLGSVVRVARLVSEPLPDKRVRAAALSLDRRDRKGLDQQDSYLLFQLPNRAPPVALNVIFAMVVDTLGCSRDSWELTYERNSAARRRQVWLGELGDSEFESFCEERHIPLMRLDWPLVAAAADAAAPAQRAGDHRGLRTGPGPPRARLPPRRQPTSTRSCASSTIAWWRCESADRTRSRNPCLRRAVGRAADALACPIAYYDRAVSSYPMSRRVGWLLDRVLERPPQGSATSGSSPSSSIGPG